MKLDSYRDLQLLHEVAQTAYVTQRDLGKRTRLALGLINLRLHRLYAKGLLKIIVEEDKKRVCYLLTPQGLSEKQRLGSEYLEFSLEYYGQVRRFLREQLLQLAERGLHRVVLFGAGEIAEVVYLTIQEVGLTLVGILGDPIRRTTFFNLPVRSPEEIPSLSFDRIILATLHPPEEDSNLLQRFGVPLFKIIHLPEDPIFFPKDGFLNLRRATLPPTQTTLRQPLEPSSTDVVVLCGGRGTRLGHLTANTPKPLLPIDGTPFLLRLLLRLQEEGFSRFILAAHYLPDPFRKFLKIHQRYLPGAKLILEPQRLGTGGGLRYAIEQVSSDTFLALNGDSWVQQPLQPVLEEHERLDREFTVVAVRASHVQGQVLKKGVWQLGLDGEIKGFETQDAVKEGWVNAGCYLMSRAMVASWPVGSYSLEANLPLLFKGWRAGVYCSEGRLLDIGTPDNYERASVILGSMVLS